MVVSANAQRPADICIVDVSANAQRPADLCIVDVSAEDLQGPKYSN